MPYTTRCDCRGSTAPGSAPADTTNIPTAWLWYWVSDLSPRYCATFFSQADRKIGRSLGRVRERPGPGAIDTDRLAGVRAATVGRPGPIVDAPDRGRSLSPHSAGQTRPALRELTLPGRRRHQHTRPPMRTAAPRIAVRHRDAQPCVRPAPVSAEIRVRVVGACLVRRRRRSTTSAPVAMRIAGPGRCGHRDDLERVRVRTRNGRRTVVDRPDRGHLGVDGVRPADRVAVAGPRHVRAAAGGAAMARPDLVPHRGQAEHERQPRRAISRDRRRRERAAGRGRPG